jgi:hypothetical protein
MCIRIKTAFDVIVLGLLFGDHLEMNLGSNFCLAISTKRLLHRILYYFLNYKFIIGEFLGIRFEQTPVVRI